jgi:hypothetical protein
MDEPVQQDRAIPGEAMVLVPKLLQKDQATSMERENLRRDHGEREWCPNGFPQGMGWDPRKLPVVTRTRRDVQETCLAEQLRQLRLAFVSRTAQPALSEGGSESVLQNSQW